MPLIAYDRSGNITTVLEFLVLPDGEGGYGLVDLEETERSGLRLRGLWEVSGASGSAHWPEHLGERFHEFRVERDRRFALPARRLVHRRSGHVRDRAAIEAAVQEAKGRPLRERAAALRAAIGHEFAPLELDDTGRTRAKVERDAEPRGGPPLRVVRRRG